MAFSYSSPNVIITGSETVSSLRTYLASNPTYGTYNGRAITMLKSIKISDGATLLVDDGSVFIFEGTNVDFWMGADGNNPAVAGSGILQFSKGGGILYSDPKNYHKMNGNLKLKDAFYAVGSGTAGRSDYFSAATSASSSFENATFYAYGASSVLTHLENIASCFTGKTRFVNYLTSGGVFSLQFGRNNTYTGFELPAPVSGVTVQIAPCRDASTGSPKTNYLVDFTIQGTATQLYADDYAAGGNTMFRDVIYPNSTSLSHTFTWDDGDSIKNNIVYLQYSVTPTALYDASKTTRLFVKNTAGTTIVNKTLTDATTKDWLTYRSNGEANASPAGVTNYYPFPAIATQYGKIPQIVSIPGTAPYSFATPWTADLGITQATVATVAAYTGISPSYSGGTLTVTVTSNHSWNEIYDYIKYWESVNLSDVLTNGAVFVSTSDKLNYTYSNLVIVVSGCSVTTATNQVLPTQPTVVSGGFYEDNNGAKWESSGAVYYASHFTYTFKDGATGKQYVEVAHYDATGTNRTYNTSRSLVTTITSNASGIAEGYAVWKIDSTSYASHTVRARLYGYTTFSTPKTLNGAFITENAALTVDIFASDTRINVAAYTGISLNYSTKVIAATATKTIQQVMDFVRYSDCLQANNQYSETRTTTNGTDWNLLTDWDVTITGSYSLTDISMSINYSGTGVLTVASGAFYEDIEGALWESSGSVYYAKHVYRNVKALTGGANQQYAVCACIDSSNNDRTYNTSRTLGGLTTDSSGNAEGYYVYKIGSTTYTINEQILAYGFDPYTVPLASNGTAIGSSGSYDTARLVTDAQVTLSRSAALAISGITVATSTDTVDLSDETFSVASDNLKARQASTSDIETGVKGYLSYVIEGRYLTKADTLYTGKSGWKYLNSVTGGTFKTGILVLDTAGIYNIAVDTCTILFTATGTYDLRGADISGTLEFTNTSGGAVTVQVPQGVTITNTGPDITLDDSLAFNVTGANIIDGAKLRLLNVTQNVELDIVAVSGGSGYSYTGTIGIGEDIEDGDEIQITITHYEKDTIFISRVASSAGIAFTETLVEDTIRTTYGIDESTVTGYTQFVADYPNVEFDFVGTGDFDWSAEELYCWYKHMITTDNGIRLFAGAIEAIDAGTLVIRTDVADMYFDNPNSGTSANESTGITISRDAVGEERPKKPSTAGSISVNWSKVYAKVVTISGASVITGDIADVPTAAENATAVIAAGALTEDNFLALK